MTDRHLQSIPTGKQPTPMLEPIRNHDQALKTLDDGSYLAYVAVQTCKFALSLLVKRWVQFR